MKRLRLPVILVGLMVSGVAQAQEQQGQEKDKKIDEVVLIGYGGVRKKDLTGSVTAVKADDFNKGVSTNPSEMLQGKAAGVQITSASGDPNAQSAVRVRGFNTIRSGGDPLYVIDGIPISSGDTSAGRGDIGFGGNAPASNPMNFINPADVESMEVLKDAAATAIYGSRGANGVILITTKKGRGEGQLTFGVTQGFGSVANAYKILDAQTFAANTGASNNKGSNVNAWDAITRGSYSGQYDLSYGGSTNKGSYKISLGYLENQGVIKNSDLKKTNLSFFADHKFFNNKLKLESYLTNTFVNSSTPPLSENIGYQGDLIISALKWNPTRALYDPTTASGFTIAGADSPRNPLNLLNYYSDKTKTFRSVGNIAATLTILKGLDYKINFGMDYSTSQRGIGMSTLINIQALNGVGTAALLNINKFSNVVEQTLNYNVNFSDKANLNALAGYSYQAFENKGQSIVTTNFGKLTDQNLYINNPYFGTTQNTSGTGSFAQYAFDDPSNKLQSYFARAIFTYDGKYVINAAIRRDGSNKFGSNNRYGNFPSFSGAWNIDKESFAPDFFNTLKLRGGWGIVGNSSFAAGQAFTYLQPVNGSWRTVNYGNPDLKWEQKRETSVGLDFGVANSRFTGSVDYFNSETKDILMQQYQLQRPTDNPYGWTNLKNTRIKSNGVEITLDYKIIKSENTNLSLGGNIAFSKSTASGITADGYDPVLGIPTGVISGQGLTDEFAQGHFDGQRLYTFNLLQFAGFDSSGISLYKTADGGTTTDPTKAVKMFSGSAIPKFTMGLYLKGNYKNLDWAINGYGKYGGKVYDNTANALFYAAALAGGGNVTTDIIGNGESTSNANGASTRFLHSGDFFRLANATLGYTIKGSGDIFKVIKSMRISVTGQNLFIITPYKGMDPEVNTNKILNGIPSYGIDYSAYPKARTILFGLNVNF